jgi:hypothetical protein
MPRARLFRFAAGALVAGMLLSGVLVRTAASQDFGTLNGTWEGDLQTVDLDGSGKTTSFPRRIVIQDRQAHVFYKSDGNWREVKPGKFRVERHLTNAIILAIDSGKDNEGTWVESWAFAVTQKDRNTIITNFMRQVNNINLPLSVAHSKFSSAATGELARK